MCPPAPVIPPFVQAEWDKFACGSECIRQLALRLNRPGAPATSEEFYNRFYPDFAARWIGQSGITDDGYVMAKIMLSKLGVIGTTTAVATSQEAKTQIRLPRCVGLLVLTKKFFD